MLFIDALMPPPCHYAADILIDAAYAMPLFTATPLLPMPFRPPLR